MMSALLTVRPGHGDMKSSRYAYRAGPANPVIVGASSATRGRFFMSSRFSMAAECGTPSGVPVLRPVLPTRIQSATQSAGKLIVADSSTKRRSPIMANANSQGEICPTATRPVSLETAVKRLRRFLAKMDHTLVITRDGSKEREFYGQYFIRDEAGKVLADKINLTAWLRSYGLMADDEELADAVPEKWHTIVLRITDESGVTIPRSFQVRSKHFSKPVRDALRDGFAGTANRDVDQVADRLMTVLSGWRNIYGPDGRELEFNHANVRMLADNFLGIGRTIVRTLLEALAKEVIHDDL